jgi:hypothetical protein
MRKVYICGLTMSAKGLLRSLLDGHRDIMNYDFDIGISLLIDEFAMYCSKPRPESRSEDNYSTEIESVSIIINIEGVPRRVTVGELFVYLFHIDKKYRDIFDVSLSKKKIVSGIGNQIISKDYQFDVFGFLQNFAERILSVKNFDSIEHLQDTLYQCVINNSETLKSNYSEKSLFVQSSYNGYEIIEKILQLNKDRKVIAVVRDPIALCFANYNKRYISFRKIRGNYGRSEVPKWLISRCLYNKYNPYLFNKTFIRQTRHYNENILRLSKADKDVYVVKTEDIICNTKNTMDGIADFLEIEREEILYKQTFVGEEPSTRGVAYDTGKIVDDPYKVLSRDQINMLKYFFDGWGRDKTFNNNVRLCFNLSILFIVNNIWLRKSLINITRMMGRLRK